MYISFGRTAIPALVDSGCTTSCISHDFFVRNKVFEQSFIPSPTEGRAINGTGVPSIGEVRLDFWLEGNRMSTMCKVIKGLVEPVVLGWDWMSANNAVLDAGQGTVRFQGGTTELVQNPFALASCFYKVPDNTTLPPFSKVLLDVELVHTHKSAQQATDTVITEPFSNNGAKFWAARSCAKVRDNLFRTEFINSTAESIKVEAGFIVGSIEFVEDGKFDAKAHQTDMFCHYSSDGLDGATPEPKTKVSADPTPPPGTQPEATSARVEDIPPGAKRLAVDYSGVANDAKAYIPRLKELVEKHSAAFSKHDRDYGKQN